MVPALATSQIILMLCKLRRLLTYSHQYFTHKNRCYIRSYTFLFSQVVMQSLVWMTIMFIRPLGPALFVSPHNQKSLHIKRNINFIKRNPCAVHEITHWAIDLILLLLSCVFPNVEPSMFLEYNNYSLAPNKFNDHCNLFITPCR